MTGERRMSFAVAGRKRQTVQTARRLAVCCGATWRCLVLSGSVTVSGWRWDTVKINGMKSRTMTRTVALIPRDGSQGHRSQCQR